MNCDCVPFHMYTDSKTLNCPQMLTQKSPLPKYQAPHHKGKEPKSGEVMLATNNHSLTAGYCKAGWALASLDSASTGEVVIHSALHMAFFVTWISGFWFGGGGLAFMKLFSKQNIIENSSIY